MAVTSDKIQHALAAQWRSGFAADAGFDSAPADAQPTTATVPPSIAWGLVDDGAALLVDIRTHAERQRDGGVPGAVHLPWLQGPGLVRNPRFVAELGRHASRSRTVLFLCASGKRSRDAVAAAARGGYTAVYSIAEGTDGDGGGAPGWRARGLPWAAV